MFMLDTGRPRAYYNHRSKGGRMTKWKGKAASLAPHVGKALLVNASFVLSHAILPSGLGGAAAALAQDECGGPPAANATITCDATTYTSGPNDDIRYLNVDGLTLNLEGGLTVDAERPVLVRSATGSSADIVVNVTDVNRLTATRQNSPPGNAAHAVEVIGRGGGDVQINVGVDSPGGRIESAGTNSDAVIARVNQNGSGNATVIMEAGTIAVGDGLQSNNIDGLNARNLGTGGSYVEFRGGLIEIEETTVANDDMQAGIHANIAPRTGVTNSEDAVGLISGGTVIGNADRTVGIRARITNAQGGSPSGNAIARMTGGEVVLNGNGGAGLYSANFGSGNAIIEMSGGTIRTGQGGAGVAVRPENGTFDVDVTGGSVTGGAGMGAGIHAMGAGGGTIDVGAGASIDGSASGVAIRDGDADLDGTDENGGNVTVTSAGTVTGDAILGLGDDIFNLTGGVYTGDIYGDAMAASAGDGGDTFTWTGGALSSGFFGGNGSDAATIGGGAAYDGNEVLDGGDDIGRADGWVDTLTFNGVTASAAADTVINWEQVNLTGTDLTLTGATWSAGGLSVDAASALRLRGGGAGMFTIAGDVDNSGTIDLQDGAAGDRLSVTGNYTAGSALMIDTVLGGDGSATDLVVIGGDSAGTTELAVTNAGGAGAPTTVGIRVVDVQGASNGSFVLDSAVTSPVTGEPIVVAGAYGYALRRGDDAGMGTSDDWYLQSSLPGSAAVTIYQPGAPIYEAFGQHGLALAGGGHAGMPTMAQRMGKRWHWPGPDGAARQGEANAYSPFGLRVIGGLERTVPTGSTTGIRTDSTRWGLRGQFDIYAREFDNGDRFFIGGVGSYDHTRSDVGSRFGDGTIDSESAGLGLTATWLGAGGAYVDAQLRANWFEADLWSDTLGALATDTGGFGYAASIEGGKRVDLGGDLWLTPQAQLSWARADFDAFTGSSGEKVSLSDAESLRLRAGLAVDRDRTWADAQGNLQRSHLYAIANLNYDFAGDSTATVSGTALTTDPAAWSGEIGLGFTRGFDDDRHQIYGEVNASTGLANFGQSYAVSGRIGFRATW